MKQRIICKTLAVAVIILFLGLAIQPSVAVTQKEVIQTSTLNPDDTRYLANLTMDFGEYITNDDIEYEDIPTRLGGNYTINVKINFRCPDDLKIVIKYEYYAHIYLDGGDVYWNTFFDVKDTITIINGSNPPDINMNSSDNLFGVWYKYWTLILKIKANLTVYEFIDGEWVKSHNDDTDKEIRATFDIVESRYGYYFATIEGNGKIDWLFRRGLFRGSVFIKSGEHPLILAGERYDRIKDVWEDFSIDVFSVKTYFFFGYSNPFHPTYDNYVKGWLLIPTTIHY